MKADKVLYVTSDRHRQAIRPGAFSFTSQDNFNAAMERLVGEWVALIFVGQATLPMEEVLRHENVVSVSRIYEEPIFSRATLS